MSQEFREQMQVERLLFLTWDGPAVPYLETLFAPVFAGVQREVGIQFAVAQFGWGDKGHYEAAKEALRKESIDYHFFRVRYQESTVGKLFAVLCAIPWLLQYIDRHNVRIVMPRSIVPGLLALLLKRHCPSVQILYDSDGLALDEKVEFGALNGSGWAYRLLRDIESQVVRRAIHTLVRTRVGADILQARAGPKVNQSSFTVIPNGRNAEVFRPGTDVERQQVRHRLGYPPGCPLVVYNGSVGAQYCLDEMASLMLALHSLDCQARWLVLANDVEAFHSVQENRWPELSAFTTVLAVRPSEVPYYLKAADVGLAFRSATFSMRAVAPVKIGEYLLSGLLVLSYSANCEGFPDELRRSPEALLTLPPTFDPGHQAKIVMSAIKARSADERAVSRTIGLKHFSESNSVEGLSSTLLAISGGRLRRRGHSH